MKKLQSLHQHLLNALPTERHYADQLQVRVEHGTLHCTSGHNLNHQQSYTVQISIDEYQDTLDELTVPLLEWLRCYEPSALTQRAVEFDVDSLPSGRSKITLRVALTERVRVHKDCARQQYTTEHMMPAYADDFCHGRRWSLSVEDVRSHQEWPLSS